MSWDDIYRKLEKEVYNNKRISSPVTIKKIKQFKEKNRQYFIEYHEFMMKNTTEETLQNYKNRRSKILDFLTFTQEELPNITQNNFNEYIYTHLDTERYTNTKNRINYIMEFLNTYNNIKIVDEFPINKSDIEENMDNNSKPLSSKEIEGLRSYYVNNKKYYELFIFEMLYNLKISINLLRQCTPNRFDVYEKAFILDNKKIQVNDNICRIINLLKYSKSKFPVLNNRTIPKMKRDLVSNGIRKDSFKRRDIIDSYKKTFISCPQCGEKFEGTADNWVVKQYYNTGELWIVCKKNCGNLNEV